VTDLGPTESAIVFLATHDWPDKAISGALDISVHAVNWRWRQVFRKTGRRTRCGAVAVAVEFGLLKRVSSAIADLVIE